MNLVSRRDVARQERAEQLRQETLARLREAVRAVLPDQAVYVYGSVVRPGAFREGSDVDVALLAEPAGSNTFRVQAELTERVGRPVDVCLLSETRLRDKIVREGELWTS
jgi:predicted nucleotidyltransferase